MRLKSKSSPSNRRAPTSLESLRTHRHKGQTTAGAAQAEEAVLSMRLLGSNPKAITEGANKLPGIANYYVGSDPRKWRTHIPTYARVKYDNVYPGVDLVYYGSQSGQLEYDFVVAPGADPSSIALSLSPGMPSVDRNAKSTAMAALRLAPNGDLSVRLKGGDVQLHKPVVYQTSSAALAGPRTMVDGHYVLTASNQVQFSVGPYDHTKPLCIDPVLTYSTYMGGGVSDIGYSIGIDGNSNAYVAGSTYSSSLPFTPNTLNGAQHSPDNSNSDAFIVELNPTGTTALYYTYLGGTGYDTALGVSVDTAGDAYLTGQTYSDDFPNLYALPGSQARALDTTYATANLPAGLTDYTYVSSFGTGFVARLAPTHGSLVFSSYLGGSTGGGAVFPGAPIAGDLALAIVVDPSCTSPSCFYVTGFTLSADFPVTSTTNSLKLTRFLRHKPPMFPS